jgi:hypothetical protein
MYPNIPIHIFLTRGVRTGKKITLKLIIQGLLRLYNKDLSSNLIKIKALTMASHVKLHSILMVKHEYIQFIEHTYSTNINKSIKFIIRFFK